MKLVVAAFAAVLLSGGAAFAADIVSAPASTLRWTGGYIGAQAGYVGVLVAPFLHRGGHGLACVP